jgi:hypothetical protein
MHACLNTQMSTYHALLVSLREALTPPEYKGNAEAEKFQDEVALAFLRDAFRAFIYYYYQFRV